MGRVRVIMKMITEPQIQKLLQEMGQEQSDGESDADGQHQDKRREHHC